MAEIFGKHAQAYWDKNIPVIPLVCLDKMPITHDWSKWCREMPSEEQRQYWLTANRANNIGMPCGEQAGIMIIDYDYENPDHPELEAKVEAAILSVTGESPWKRVGKRGCVRAYKYNPKIAKKITINDKSGKIVMEGLTNGSQVVLPPSIHPKTMKEYTENCSLVSVLDQLTTLPDDLEDRLRVAIAQIVELKSKSFNSKFKSIDVVPAGARDIQMTRNAGARARMVMMGECSLRAALEDMSVWYENKVEQVVGDKIDVSKGHRNIINFLISDVTTKNKILPPGWDANITEEEKKAWGLDFDAAYEEWTLQQCLDYIEKANVHRPDSAERMDAINFILRKLSKSAKLDIISVERILSALKSDTNNTVATFKKQLKQMKQGTIEGLSHTEIAQEVIKEMEEKHGQMAFWNGLLWSWEGSHWAILDEQIIRNYIQIQFGGLLMSKKFSDHKQIVSVVKDLLPQTIKPAMPVQGVNFSNGFLTKELKLMAHTPEFGMTYTLPFCYKPELSSKCPLFLEFLRYSWGDDPDYEQKMMALQEAIACTLFGSATSYQKVFLLYGNPNTGKSLLMEIVSAMVPDEARCAVSPDVWAEPYIAAQFARMILNVCGELDKDKMMSGKLFKEVVVGDEITSRYIYGAPFKFRPKAAHWFASNFLPKTKDTSSGFTRRWLILEFNRVVPEKDRIIDHGSTIVYEEIEAIVAWALQSYPRLVKNENYTLPSSHESLSDQLGRQNSTVRSWAYEFVTFDTNAPVMKEKDIYQNYYIFCLARGQSHTMAQTAWSLDFNMMLGDKGLPKGVDGPDGKTYRGLVIKK